MTRIRTVVTAVAGTDAVQEVLHRTAISPEGETRSERVRRHNRSHTELFETKRRCVRRLSGGINARRGAALVVARDSAAHAAPPLPPAAASMKRKVKSEEDPPDMPAGARVKLEEQPPPMPNDAVVKVEFES